MRLPLLTALLLLFAHPAVGQPEPIVLPQDTLLLSIGETARMIPEYNIPGRYAIRWTTDRPDVVNVASDGTVSGLKPGQATVIVTAKGNSAVIGVTVRPLPPVRLKVTSPMTTLAVGTSAPLSVTALDRTGSPTPPVRPLFDTSDPGVARVDQTGRVYAVAPGRAEIWVVRGSLEERIEISVEPADFEDVDVLASSYEGRTGDVIRLQAVAMYSGGSLDRPLYPAWFVDRPGAVIGSEGVHGMFVAEEPGTYHVTALVGDGITRSVTLDVGPRVFAVRLETVGRGPADTHNSADTWVFEGLNGRDYAYIGTFWYDWMKVWDVTDPARPVLTDSVQVDARRINDVKIHPSGELAIITREGASDRRNGIVLLDLSDPAHPTILSEYTDTVTGGVHNVWILGSHELVYAVHNGTRDIHIIDIADPTAPREVGRWGLENEDRSLHDVIVQEGYAFLSYWDDGLVILDAGAGTHGGTPREPTFVSRIAYPEGNTHTAWYDGRYVFVGDEIFPDDWQPDRPIKARGYIHVIDLADIEHPHEVARYEVPEAGAHNVWVENDRLYVGYYQAGLRVVDVSGELRGDLYRQGREIARLATTDGDAYVPNWPMTFSAQVYKGLIYSADFNSGLWITRLEDVSPLP